MAIRSTADDYKRQLIALAPKGGCWPVDESSTWILLLEALAQEFYRVDDSINDLIEEAFPNTTSVLLENWERITGLPDECEITGATEAQRRAAVYAKIRGRGGQSAAYFEEVIEALGYTGTVEDLHGFRTDRDGAGYGLYGDDWVYAFLVTVPGGVDDETSFECSINKLKPAHTIGFFEYS